MELTIYDVIFGPVMSDKAYKLNKKFKTLVLRVHPKANKPMIKEAIEKLFKVEVADIKVLIRKGKTHNFMRGLTVTKSSEKRAMVILKEGHSIEIFDQPGVAVTPSESASRSAKVEGQENLNE